MGKTRKEILDAVKKCICEVYEEQGADVKQLEDLFASDDSLVEETDLYWEIGFCSLEMQDFVCKVNESLQVNIPDESLVYINTIGDMVNYLYKKINID